MDSLRHSAVVLLADDSVMIRNMLRNLLQREGYEVIPAADGAEVVEVSRNHPGSIDLLITDVEMPHIDGVAAYLRISVERPDLKVLFMSGTPSGHVKVPQTLPFLAKPFEMEVLREKVGRILKTIPPERRERQTILVVDSNTERQQRTGTILTDNGYEVLEASSVEAAKTLTDGIEAIDLVISGVVFPGQSGIDLAEHVETSDRAISTLLISHFHRDLLHGLAGFSRQPEFLQNPFTPEDLLTQVRRLLQKR